MWVGTLGVVIWVVYLVRFYLSLVVDEGDTQIGHGSQDGHQRLNCVAVDNRSILFEIVRCEAALVDNSIRKMQEI